MVKKYKEILRYHSNGFSQRQIASLTGVSRGTVIKVIDDNVNIKFTKNDSLKITNLDHVYSSRESRTSFVL